MTNLITKIEPATAWEIEEEEKANETALQNFDPIIAAKQRFKEIRKHSKKIGVEIPYDPFFMD